MHGYRGKHLELAVPDHARRRGTTSPRCVDGNLSSWVAAIDAGRRRRGRVPRLQRVRVTIEEFWMALDVEGTRLVIEATWSPASPPADVAEMRAILRSIRVDDGSSPSRPTDENPLVTAGSPLLRSGHVDADDPLVAVLVGDHGERGRVAVIDDGPTRRDGGGDPLLGHFGRHIDLDVEPLTRGLVLVGVPEPQIRYLCRGVPDLVAGGSAALGLSAPGQQDGPHRGDGRSVRRVEAELDVADRGRVGVEPVVGGDLGDPSRKVDVLLGHPFDDVFRAVVVAVDGVVGDELEVDVPIADRHARVMAERVARLARPRRRSGRRRPKSSTTYRACSPWASLRQSVRLACP